MSKLTKYHWLKFNAEDDGGALSIGPKFAAQMYHWLPTVLQTVVTCLQCQFVVLRGEFCPCGKTGRHFTCKEDDGWDDIELFCNSCTELLPGPQEGGE